jgi:hypothetical protein
MSYSFSGLLYLIDKKFVVGPDQKYLSFFLYVNFLKTCHSQKRAFGVSDPGTGTVRRISVPPRITAVWHKGICCRQKKAT